MEKIVLKGSDFLLFVNISNILYCKGDNQRTCFFLVNEPPVEVNNGIDYYQDILPAGFFIKSSRGILVNIKHVESIRTAWPRYLELSNKKRLPLSYSRRNHAIEMIQRLQS
jgi:two-component system, LytTR family, response regulator